MRLEASSRAANRKTVVYMSFILTVSFCLIGWLQPSRFCLLVEWSSKDESHCPGQTKNASGVQGLAEHHPCCSFSSPALPSCVDRFRLDGLPGRSLPAKAIECARDCGVTEGMPFFLDDEGHYHAPLNAFLRSCPTMGVRSTNSLRAYALDILFDLGTISSLWSRRRGRQRAYGEPIAMTSRRSMRLVAVRKQPFESRRRLGTGRSPRCRSSTIGRLKRGSRIDRLLAAV